MKVLLIFLTSIIESLIWLNIVSFFVEKNSKKIVNICLSFGLTMSVFIKSIISEKDATQTVQVLLMIVNFIYVMWAAFRFFEGSTINKFLGVITYVIGVGLTDLLIIILGDLLLGMNVNNFSQVTFLGVVYSLLGKNILLVAILILKNIFSDKILIYNKGRNTLVIMFLLNTILFMVLYLIFISDKTIFTQELVFLFLGSNLVITTILTITAYREMEKKSRVILYDELKLQHQELELVNYKSLDEVHRKMRALQHDISNYISVIQSLIALEQYEELTNFLSELSDEFSEFYEYIMTDNKILNAVLNTKRMIAQEKGIKFTLLIEVKNIQFTDLEISSLFGNILDNAIEGCEGVENPEIELEIKDINNGTKISCWNTCLKGIQWESGKLRSTKTNAEKHGIGSENIAKIVKHSNGVFTYNHKDDIFSLEIFIPKDVIKND